MEEKMGMKKVTVIDEIMGSGKTTKEIEKLKRSNGAFLYVTPFLKEVERILEKVPKTFQPQVSYYKDLNGEENILCKRDSLLNMANKKLNIATTHSLFTQLKVTDYSFFYEYELILDEVIQPVEVINLHSHDVDIAFERGLLVVNEENLEVTFTGDNYKGTLYHKLKGLCESKRVTYLNNRLLVWAFPPEIFMNFKSVRVLTYLFEGSLLSSYFKFYDIPYDIVSKPEEEEIKIKSEIARKLNIYEGKANRYGNVENSFSVNWLKNCSNSKFKQIKSSTANLLERNFKSNSKNTGFTTFKSFKSKLKGKGYSNGFISINERATNMYAHKQTMIYLANKYLCPNTVDFFRIRSIEVNQDAWALGELLQWIWRGQIREGENMNLYIPSKRMRRLLKDWLNNDKTNGIRNVA